MSLRQLKFKPKFQLNLTKTKKESDNVDQEKCDRGDNNLQKHSNNLFHGEDTNGPNSSAAESKSRPINDAPLISHNSLSNSNGNTSLDQKESLPDEVVENVNLLKTDNDKEIDSKAEQANDGCPASTNSHSNNYERCLDLEEKKKNLPVLRKEKSCVKKKALLPQLNHRLVPSKTKENLQGFKDKKSPKNIKANHKINSSIENKRNPSLSVKQHSEKLNSLHVANRPTECDNIKSDEVLKNVENDFDDQLPNNDTSLGKPIIKNVPKRPTECTNTNSDEVLNTVELEDGSNDRLPTNNTSLVISSEDQPKPSKRNNAFKINSMTIGKKGPQFSTKRLSIVNEITDLLPENSDYISVNESDETSLHTLDGIKKKDIREITSSLVNGQSKKDNEMLIELSDSSGKQAGFLKEVNNYENLAEKMELLTNHLKLRPNFSEKHFSSSAIVALNNTKSIKKNSEKKPLLFKKHFLKSLKQNMKGKCLHDLTRNNNFKKSASRSGSVIKSSTIKRPSQLNGIARNPESKLKRNYQVNGTFVESSIPRNKIVYSSRTNEIFGSKSIRSCQRKPVKPILAERSNRAINLSLTTYGKMCSEAKEKFVKKFGDKTPDSSKLTMLDLIFYNPSSNPMPEVDKKNSAESDKSEKCSDGKDEEKSSLDSNDPSSGNEDIKTNDPEVPVPQLKISADGKVIVSQESLVVEQSLGEVSADVEFVTDKPSKKVKKSGACRQGWTHEETLKFYRALHSIGSDFELMKTLFPGRSRRNLKSKFKKEERIHGGLLDKVMFHHAEFNPDDVCQELDDEHKLEVAKATSGRNMQVQKRKRFDNFDNHPTIRPKRDSSDKLSAKELKAILNSEEEPVEEACNSSSGKSTSITTSKRRKIKKKHPKEDKSPRRYFNDIIKRNTPNKTKFKNEKNNEQSKSKSAKKNDSIPTNGDDDHNDHIVISTNIEYDNVKYTRYITYDSSNLENPVEINETISHE